LVVANSVRIGRKPGSSEFESAERRYSERPANPRLADGPSRACYALASVAEFARFAFGVPRPLEGRRCSTPRQRPGPVVSRGRAWAAGPAIVTSSPPTTSELRSLRCFRVGTRENRGPPPSAGGSTPRTLTPFSHRRPSMPVLQRVSSVEPLFRRYPAVGLITRAIRSRTMVPPCFDLRGPDGRIIPAKGCPGRSALSSETGLGHRRNGTKRGSIGDAVRWGTSDKKKKNHLRRRVSSGPVPRRETNRAARCCPFSADLSGRERADCAGASGWAHTAPPSSSSLDGRVSDNA